MKIRFYLACLTLFIFSSCANDKLDPFADISCNTTDPVTYYLQIKPIIDASCAYSGCHDGVSDAPNNYGTYAGMQVAINNNAIFNRVITSLNTAASMPPSTETALEVEELRLIQCWINDGHPEN